MMRTLPRSRKSIAGKADAALEQLAALARTLGPDARMPPVRELCSRLGVSQVTLNAVLDRLEGQHFVYRRQGSGIYVSPRLGQRNVCLLCDPGHVLGATSPFWGRLVAYARRRAEAKGEHLVLYFSSRPDGPFGEVAASSSVSPAVPDGLVQDIDAGRLHGALVVGLPREVCDWLEDQGVPVVAFAGASEYMVQLARGELIQVAVAQLARRGCRRIALWHPSPARGIGYDGSYEHDVFVGALAANGLPCAPGLAAPLGRGMSEDANNLPAQGVTVARGQFGPGSDPAARPDGVVCTDDMMAQGGLMALQRLGFAPGRDVQVATHANADTAVLYAWEDAIIRLEFDQTEIMHALFEMLEARMEGGAPAEDDDRNQADLYDDAGRRPPEHIRLVRPRLLLPAGDV